MTRCHTHTIGAATVSVLTDGDTAFGPELFPGTEPAHIADLLGSAPAAATNFNAALIRSGGRVILADAGPRDLFGPTCGFLADGLAEAGAKPEQVDTLFATHLHPDHIAGMITADGKAVFPNAELVITQGEYEFWSKPDVTDALPEPVNQWAGLARAVLAAYAGRVRVIANDGEIAPGLHAVSLPGHTPGHSGWRLDDGGQTLLHVGDIIHAPALQAPDPEIAIAFDMDMGTARATRKRILDHAATDALLITGGHFLAPKFFHAERRGAGYALVSA